MLRETFREAGERLTAQREQVWRTIRRRKGGMTISEVAHAVEHLNVGLATVYRTIAVLENLDLLRRVHDHRGEHRYVATRPGHAHPLVCRSCGLVVEFEACDLHAFEERLAAETGFTIESHELEVHGVCPQCQRCAS